MLLELLKITIYFPQIVYKKKSLFFLILALENMKSVRKILYTYILW